jgi:hypothetical protein
VTEFPDRPTVWVGDMNVAPLEKDADVVGIRKSLQRVAQRKVLASELPSCSDGECRQLQELMHRLDLVDAFEEHSDKPIGRDAVGIACFSNLTTATDQVGRARE